MKLLLFVCLVSHLAAQELTDRERMLLDRIEALEKRIAVLEKKAQPLDAAEEKPAAAGKSALPQESTGAALQNKPALPPEPVTLPALPWDLTLSVDVDGYYSYNFNQPIDRRNALRAYDYSHNSFSLNQTGMIVESAPDVAKGKRAGGRLDLMFGQATETLQGSPANEPRPDVYRHIFQAYGTYIAPVGKGLTVDFGKFAGALGVENNYTKDQWNYSRSYWFNYSPYYHMGLRATYPLTSKWNVTYWLVNGTNQTEDFNGLKSQAVLLQFNPSTQVSANLNYFNGQEQPEQNGVTPRGRSHFVDGYLTWQASKKWAFAGEANYVISRVHPDAAPQRVTGLAGYARYRFNPRFQMAGRFGYLNDLGGLFSGKSQALKETTLTATFDIVQGFQMRWEYRRDWSDLAYFVTANPAQQKREQNTALLGLLWWFGGKQGVW